MQAVCSSVIILIKVGYRFALKSCRTTLNACRCSNNCCLSCTTCSLRQHYWLAVQAGIRHQVVIQRRKSNGQPWPQIYSPAASGPPHLRKLVSISRLQIPLHFRHELIQRGCQVGLLLILQTRVSHVRSLQMQHAMVLCLHSTKTNKCLQDASLIFYYFTECTEGTAC